MSTFEDILGAAQGLPAMERLQLIDALWESVPPQQWPAPSDQWISEAQRRSAQYDAGQMSASTWPEVKARARRKL